MTVLTEPREMYEADAGTTVRVHSTTIDDQGVEWRKVDGEEWQRVDDERVRLYQQAFRSAVRAGLVELVEETSDNVTIVDLADIQREAVEARDRALHETLVETVGDDESISRDDLWQWMDENGLGRPEVTAYFEIIGTAAIDLIPDPDGINSSWNRHDLNFDDHDEEVNVRWSMEIDEITIPRTSSDSCGAVDEDFIEEWLQEQGIPFEPGTISFERRRCSQCA